MDGQFTSVFEKLSKLHSKNSFSLGIILGDLFANPAESSDDDDKAVSALVKGKITIPLPIYFTIGNHALPQQIVEKLEKSDGEVCPNLYFLGKRSTTKTSEGLRIVAFGGSLDPGVTAGLSKDKYLPFHTEDDAKSLRGANTADILITSQWPLQVRTGSEVNVLDGVEEPLAEQCIADLCSTLRPRYHFSTSKEIFYEREPFFHAPKEEQPDEKTTTRFISLAAFNNPSKQKWLYAFSIDPKATIPSAIPAGTTASPFTDSSRKRLRLPPQDEYFSRFSNHDHHHQPSKRARQALPTPLECFFCLSNPNTATHLITSIADNTYLTTAKGPLSNASTFPTLGFPAHILIIPLSHSPTMTSISDTEIRSATHNEVQRYRQALHSLLMDKSRDGLGSVTWEVSRAEGIHIHWQFLPVTSDLITKGLVEAAFKVEAENEKYPMFKTKEIGDGAAEKGDYFRVWIWRPGEGEKNGDSRSNTANHPEEVEKADHGKEVSLVLPLSPDFRFDLQFGRRVMAKLLQLEARMNWRDCQQTEAEETNDAEAFKKAFKQFDFSLES